MTSVSAVLGGSFPMYIRTYVHGKTAPQYVHKYVHKAIKITCGCTFPLLLWRPSKLHTNQENKLYPFRKQLHTYVHITYTYVCKVLYMSVFTRVSPWRVCTASPIVCGQ